MTQRTDSTIAVLALALAACRESKGAAPANAPQAATHQHEDAAGYAPPAGLKWGQSPDEAKKALLASGFSFQGQELLGAGHVKQTYQGTLEGFALESATVNFRDGELNALILMLPDLDPRPATQRWQELVDAMRRTGGAPSRLSPLPKASGAVGGGPGDYAALDRRIREGLPSPYATWVSKNSAVTISINANKLAGSGVRALRPSWAFFGPGSLRLEVQHQDAEVEGEEE